VLWHATPPVAASAGNLVVTKETVCYTYSPVNDSAQQGVGIVALHAADGSLAWQAAPNALGPVALAASNGVLYAVEPSATASAASSLTLHAFDASTGRTLFDRPFPNLPVQLVSDNSAPPQVADGATYLLYTAVQPGRSGPPQPLSVVLALSTSDGRPKWVRTFNGEASFGDFVAP
jgi:outer membrane protein assembly factor BamB